MVKKKVAKKSVKRAIKKKDSKWSSGTKNRIIIPQPVELKTNGRELLRERVFRAAEDAIEHATIPIIHVKNDKVTDNRSGVLLQIGDMSFIITAGHYMIDLHNDGHIPAIVMQGKGSHPIPIVVDHWWTTTNKHEDLSVARLRPETLKLLGDAYGFLRIDDLRSRLVQGDGGYLLMGYPLDMVRPDDDRHPRVDTWKYLTYRYPDVENVEDYDPGLHIVLKYEKATKNKEGGRVHPPAMSGCGIWSIDLRPNCMIGPEGLKLVAIQNGWHKGFEYAKGTWIDIVLTIIWKYYSDARGPLRMHGFQL